MNTLVTGGAGFVGSTLVDRMLAAGHHVDVVDDLSAGSLANLAAARRDAAGRLKIHQCDVRDDGLADLMVRRRPDVVYHLASGGDRSGGASRSSRAAIDLGGTVQVLEGARRSAASKVVLVGSVRDAATSSMPGLVRHMVTELGLRHRELHDVACTIVDLPTVFGPRQRPDGEDSVVATFAARFAAGLPCVVHGTGDQTRDLLYVDDAVDALVRAADVADGLRIAIGTGEQTSIRNLHRAMAAVLGMDAEPVHGEARPDAAPSLPVDPVRARMYLGWEAFTPLAEGLLDTLVGAD